MQPHATEHDAFLRSPSAATFHSSTKLRRKPIVGSTHDPRSDEALQVEEEEESVPTESSATKTGSAVSTQVEAGLARVHVRTRYAEVLRWWYFEVISICAALACLAGIVVVLLIFDGEPQDSWSSSILTLNGFVALLATLCRTFYMIGVGAALAQGKWLELSGRSNGDDSFRIGLFGLFEDAAKGPLGSTRLIWRYKGLSLSCLGAAVSVFSLGFSVFSQQLIGLRTNVIESQHLQTGKVPRATQVRGAFQRPSGTLEMTQLNAIFNGITSKSIESPAVTCPSGNCTWPIIPTMGVCGACVNMTDRIHTENVPNKDHYWRCRSTVKDKQSNETIHIEVPCFEVGWIESDDVLNAPDEPILFSSGPGSGHIFDSEKVPIREDDRGLIAHFTGLGIQLPEEIEHNMYSVNKSLAFECALWLCIQAHNISVENGELHDEVIGASNKMDRWGRAKSEHVPEEFNADAGELYDFSIFNNFGEYFDTITNGAVQGRPDNYTVENTGGFIEIFWRNLRQADLWIERLAKSISNDIRLMGTTHLVNEDERGNIIPEKQRHRMAEMVREHYRGKVLVEQVVIVVRWRWIVYPATVVAFSVIVLIISIAQTARRPDVRAWKDDPLASMCLELDATLQEEFRQGLKHADGVAKVIGKRVVEVDRDEHGAPRGFHAKQD